jgi:endoglycosylceramidase
MGGEGARGSWGATSARVGGLVVMAAVGCGEAEVVSAVPPDEPPPDGIHVRDGFLRDEEGRALVLRGANVANAHKTAPYFGFHRPEDFERLRDEWGMNSVRFLVTWSAIEPERGVYDREYLDGVRERMDWAASAGLFVVLDMHQDVYGEGFGGDGAPRWTCAAEHYDAFEPISPWFLNYLNEHVVACFDAFWGSDELQDAYADAVAELATRLADHPAVLGFDVMNEPYWGSALIGVFEKQSLQPFYEKVVARVREVAPAWIAFVEPAASRNLGIPTGLAELAFDQAVYAPHSYDREAEEGGGFSAERRGAVLDNLTALRGEADSLGAALWVGEYGGVSRVGAGSAYWAYDRDDGYGMLDPAGDEKPELMAALVRPAPTRVAGDDVAFAFDEETRRFTLSFRPDATLDAPTEIAVPKRVYPDGYTVECGGCAWETEGAALFVRGLDGAHDVVITPSP